MKIKQSCNNCKKQQTCEKATHIENYRLDGCSEFLAKDIFREDDIKNKSSERS